LSTKVLKNAIAAPKVDTSKPCQPNIKTAFAIFNQLGLKGNPKKMSDFADMYPEYFTYSEKHRKLNYKPKP